MKLFLPLLCVVGALGLRAQTETSGADAVLARMDAAAPSFHAMSAAITMTTMTAIINDKTVEYGELRMQKSGSEVRAVLDFGTQKNASRQIGFFGKTIRIYYPKLNTYQDYDVGKNTDVLNQFLLLGFGTSGKDLVRSYDVKAAGQENLSGRSTTKLLLEPKDPEVRKRLTKIEMWIPDNQAYPIQQQFFEPSGNYRIVEYNNVKLNPSIKGKLELKLPSDAKRQGP
jgi:outer membrane lipoprotein-sorting protein